MKAKGTIINYVAVGFGLASIPFQFAYPNFPVHWTRIVFWSGIGLIVIGLLDLFFHDKIATWVMPQVEQSPSPFRLVNTTTSSKTPLQSFKLWIDKQLIYGEQLRVSASNAEVSRWYEKKVGKGVMYAIGTVGIHKFENMGIKHNLQAAHMYPSYSGLELLEIVIYCLQDIREGTNPQDLLSTFRPEDLP